MSLVRYAPLLAAVTWQLASIAPALAGELLPLRPSDTVLLTTGGTCPASASEALVMTQQNLGTSPPQTGPAFTIPAGQVFMLTGLEYTATDQQIVSLDISGTGPGASGVNLWTFRLPSGGGTASETFFPGFRVKPGNVICVGPSTVPSVQSIRVWGYLTADR